MTPAERTKDDETNVLLAAKILFAAAPKGGDTGSVPDVTMKDPSADSSEEAHVETERMTDTEEVPP
eukprot:11629499-Heterocapsa_arctica.AAC.1